MMMMMMVVVVVVVTAGFSETMHICHIARRSVQEHSNRHCLQT
jgi:hypothetical protein